MARKYSKWADMAGVEQERTAGYQHKRLQQGYLGEDAGARSQSLTAHQDRHTYRIGSLSSDHLGAAVYS